MTILFRPFGFIAPKTLYYLAFQFWAYLMNVIPETRRAHYIWYLRFLIIKRKTKHTTLCQLPQYYIYICICIKSNMNRTMALYGYTCLHTSDSRLIHMHYVCVFQFPIDRVRLESGILKTSWQTHYHKWKCSHYKTYLLNHKMENKNMPHSQKICHHDICIYWIIMWW